VVTNNVKLFAAVGAQKPRWERDGERYKWVTDRGIYAISGFKLFFEGREVIVKNLQTSTPTVINLKNRAKRHYKNLGLKG